MVDFNLIKNTPFVKIVELEIVRFFIVKFIHDKIHGIFGDKDDKYKEIADNLFINGIMDEKEYTSVINKKETSRDDFDR